MHADAGNLWKGLELQRASWEQGLTTTPIPDCLRLAWLWEALFTQDSAHLETLLVQPGRNVAADESAVALML